MASTLRVEAATSAGALGRELLERRLRARRARRPAPCVGVDGLLLGGELRFGAFSAAVRSSASSIRSSICVFERLDLGLREGDLVLDRVVFLVGLHRHRLLAELRQAALVHGDVLLDVAARAFWLSASCSFAAATCWRAASSRASSACSRSGSSASRRSASCGGGVEPLQGDQSFEISVHESLEHTKKAPALAHRGLVERCIQLRVARIGRTAICSVSDCSSQSRERMVGPPGFEPGTGRL